MKSSDYLLRCITLAKYRFGFCAPNPAVGCVVVKDEKIISEGFHFGCGHSHAEVDALDKIGDDALGATLYVSLEPCCHYGRTPPCTERIKKAGIKKVYFGLQDPNPIVAGKGQQALISAGIACEQIKLTEIEKFYAPYVHWTRTKMPYAIFKIAMSKDEKIAFSDGKPAQITGSGCHTLTHRYRLESDALLTTINTIINDDPKMNVRFEDQTIAKKIYVLDSQAKFPLTATLFKTAESITLFHAHNAPKKNIDALEKKSVRCICVENSVDGLNLKAVLAAIGADGVHQLWIEAGARCLNSFLSQDLLQEIIVYVSPEILGEEAMPVAISEDVLKRQFQLIDQCTLEKDVVFHWKNKGIPIFS